MLTKNEKQIYRNSILHEPEITNYMHGIEDIFNVSLYNSGTFVKTEDSLDEKLHKRIFKEDIRDITDIIRYSLIIENNEYSDKTRQIIDYIQRNMANEYKIEKIKNYWINQKNPYLGINVNLITEDGVRFEIQFHTKESRIANDNTHRWYSAKRLCSPSDIEYKYINTKIKDFYSNVPIPRGVEDIFKSQESVYKRKSVNELVMER